MMSQAAPPAETHPVRRILIVGGGTAALCAALSARECGAGVVLMERAPEEQRGGNSSYAAGTIRFAYGSAQEIYDLVPDLSAAEIASSAASSVISSTLCKEQRKI